MVVEKDVIRFGREGDRLLWISCACMISIATMDRTPSHNIGMLAT